MSCSLNIALAQINPVPGDLQNNRDRMLDVWQQIATAQSAPDLIVFPEMVLSGYPPEDLVLNPGFLDRTEDIISDIVSKSHDLPGAAVIGCAWRTGAHIYNAVHVIQNGEIHATRYKQHLPNYGVFDEKRVFDVHEKQPPVDFKGEKLGLMVCEDMWFPDVAAHLKREGATVLIAPHASPFETDKNALRIEHARHRTRETGLPLICVNQIGGQDDLVFDGGSFAMAENGDVPYQSPLFAEDITMVCFAEKKAQSYSLRPSSLYADFPVQDEKTAHHALDDPHAQIYAALCLGLRDYVAKNNIPGVLIGLSGGVDSALVATLAVDTLGAARVRCIMMPSAYTSQESLDDAARLSENLSVPLETIPITAVTEALHDTLKNSIPADAPPVTFENMQSRARGLILMSLSNATGSMVLSTGNKSEMATGYATLYGDMCGGFNPLKDVYKTQVYALCRWRNARSTIIPENILTKAPTAELKEGQTDQDSLPPYEILDGILAHMIEDDLSIRDIVAKGYENKTVRQVQSLLKRAEYKRRQAPPGPKVSRRAFERERRYPITNRFTDE